MAKFSKFDVALATVGMTNSGGSPISRYLEEGRAAIRRKEMAEAFPFLTRKIPSQKSKKTYTIIVKKDRSSAKLIIHDTPVIAKK